MLGIDGHVYDAVNIRDGNEYKIWKWLVFKFHGSGHLQLILHLNKITESLKMTTFKIVFTLDVFLVLKPHNTADVLHSYLVSSIHLAKKKQI